MNKQVSWKRSRNCPDFISRDTTTFEFPLSHTSRFDSLNSSPDIDIAYWSPQTRNRSVQAVAAISSFPQHRTLVPLRHPASTSQGDSVNGTTFLKRFIPTSLDPRNHFLTLCSSTLFRFLFHLETQPFQFKLIGTSAVRFRSGIEHLIWCEWWGKEECQFAG